MDWENFKISLAGGNRAPNVSALKEEVANHGRVVVAKAYADWVTRSPELKGASQFIIDPPALYASGIEPVYVPTRLPLGSPSAMNSRTTRVKNSVDVKMTADCIECAHSYPNIGTYVLVSGDSDFIHVINSLRAIGKRVIIIGVSWSTSRRLADQVDGLILYDIDVDPEIQQAPEPAPAMGRSSRASSSSRQQLADVMRVIEDVVRSERQAGRTPLLTSLKQRIMRRVPGFDEKKLGFSGFKKLMLRTAEEGNIKLVTVGLVDWVIRADETIPEEAMPETQPAEGAIESVAAGEEVVPDTAADTATEPDAPAAPESEEAGSKQTGSKETGRRTSRSRAKAAPEAVAEAQPEAPQAEAAASSDPISVTGEDQQQIEAASDATEMVEEDAPAPAISPELERVLEETLAQLELPRGPGDGQDGRRIADLVIMADMLEHQEGISHVAFNFLLSEICGALQQGLEAEHPEITSRWGGRTYSRTYVTRLLRELGDKEVFLRDWHQERNEETGRSRRFRTFNLNRSNPLVKVAVVSQWGPDTDAVSTEAESSGEAVEEDAAVVSSDGPGDAAPGPEVEPAVAGVE
ncbi:MAG: NYN domain-containing protein [Chloroflexota bacterium]|nr:NYN domain-containing protein [Chloroflexota bacterium]